MILIYYYDMTGNKWESVIRLALNEPSSIVSVDHLPVENKM